MAVQRSILDLSNLIKQSGNAETIDLLEEQLSQSIETVAEEKTFFELPTKNILNVIKKSNTGDVQTLKKLVEGMSSAKKEDAPLLLNIIDTYEGDLEQCTDIILSLVNCPLCKRVKNMRENTKKLPVRDYESEIKTLEKEIQSLKEELEIKSKPKFTPIVNKPEKFEANIFVAVQKGDLPSVQYSIEHSLAGANDKNSEGWSLLHYSSFYGHLLITQYLVEQCNVPINVRDNIGWTPLYNAISGKRLPIVKYLIGECGANVNEKDNDGFTPIIQAGFYGDLPTVQYLVEQCHANVEQKNNIGETALGKAAENGHMSVVQYLVEVCHATIRDNDISYADNREIENYLRARRETIVNA